jgi:hypothetical protein
MNFVKSYLCYIQYDRLLHCVNQPVTILGLQRLLYIVPQMYFFLYIKTIFKFW